MSFLNTKNNFDRKKRSKWSSHPCRQYTFNRHLIQLISIHKQRPMLHKLSVTYIAHRHTCTCIFFTFYLLSDEGSLHHSNKNHPASLLSALFFISILAFYQHYDVNTVLKLHSRLNSGLSLSAGHPFIVFCISISTGKQQIFSCVGSFRSFII